MGRKIDLAIQYYKDHREEILDFINRPDELGRKHRLDSDIIIKKGKDLEAIAFKLEALRVAKNN